MMPFDDSITIRIPRKTIDALTEMLAKRESFVDEFYTADSIEKALPKYLEFELTDPQWFAELIDEDKLLLFCERDWDAVLEAENAIDDQKRYEASMGGSYYLGKPVEGWTGLL